MALGIVDLLLSGQMVLHRKKSAFIRIPIGIPGASIVTDFHHPVKNIVPVGYGQTVAVADRRQVGAVGIIGIGDQRVVARPHFGQLSVSIIQEGIALGRTAQSGNRSGKLPAGIDVLHLCLVGDLGFH